MLIKQEMMGVAVASAGPYANHLHLAADRTMPSPHHSIFYSQDTLSDANKQHQNTEGLVHTVVNSTNDWLIQTTKHCAIVKSFFCTKAVTFIASIAGLLLQLMIRLYIHYTNFVMERHQNSHILLRL